jgi:hypothetical protein
MNDHDENPYQASRLAVPAEVWTDAPVVKFRWCLVGSPIVGLALSGIMPTLLKLQVEHWPMAIFANEWGPWKAPLNIVLSMVVFAVIPILQCFRLKKSRWCNRLAWVQAGIWSAYWLLIALAGRWGVWRGP